ncbi:MAG: hypothetical protein MRZ45_09265 [Blautia sp.]|nr:hypothetical protein [Blautia sp.]
MNGMNISIANYAKLCCRLKAMNKNAEKAISRTVSDFKSRAPGWISQAVTEEYTIKKNEVKNAMTGARKVGSIEVRGTAVDNIQLVYEGRMLTPTHFKMSPKKPSTVRQNARLIPGQNTSSNSDVVVAKPLKSKAITVEIHKGQKKVLSGKYDNTPFLASNRGDGFIPFQRRGEERSDIVSIKTTSVPQMITNEKVSASIQEKIIEGIQSRLEHHVAQALK